MGLFFSSLTRNQIAAALLSAAGMLGWTITFFLKGRDEGLALQNVWATLLKHVSYIDLWITSMQGLLAPQYLVFHISMTIFWLFLTVKVLEARRWA
jgi:ABC-2 type transport system permease protein